MGYRLIVICLCLIFFSNISYCQKLSQSSNKLNKLVDHAIEKSLQTLKNSVNEVKDPSLYPTYATKDLQWKLKTSADWTSGFYPGCLWYAYQLSNDQQFKQWAIDWTAGIEKEKYNFKTHDLGFRFGCTFVKGLSLAPNDTATKRYKEIILTAASTMDKRFYPQIGAYTSDWDFKPLPNSVPVVIDIMMNLEMLLWTAQNGGDTGRISRCKTHVATSYRDLIRNDASSYHIARYDSTTGKLLQQGQLQGDTDESTWTRGHAWMIYGLVTVYRFTKEEQYLQKAIQVTDYFLNHLPKDKIAPWDFQSTLSIKDASASAIVCAALFELQGYLNDYTQQQHYLSEAKKILASMCTAPYFSEGKGTNCLLLHSTQYYYRTDNTDVPATFADYYFMESLVRYKALQSKANNKVN